MSRLHAIALGLALMPLAAAAQPASDPRGGLTFSYENDLLGGTDRYYTSGVQLAWRSPSAELPPALDWLNRQFHFLDGPGRLRWGLGLGHQIYTPQDTLRPVPDPLDRPYAGFLYGAAVIQRDTGFALSTMEIQAGVVGPSALGEFVQNNVHDLIRDDSANGWDSQLKDEPVANLTLQRVARLPLATVAGVELDALPSASVALGTVTTHLGAGGMLRLGQGLEADYGPPRIRPALVGSAFFQPRQEFGWYVFAGGQGRAVARDIFLDGNTWRDQGPSVDRRPLVADLQAGFAIHWRGLRLAYSQVWRTEEFYGQRGGNQSFGSLSLTMRF